MASEMEDLADLIARIGTDPSVLPIHPDSALGRAIASGGPLPPGIRMVSPGRYEVVSGQNGSPAAPGTTSAKQEDT